MKKFVITFIITVFILATMSVGVLSFHNYNAVKQELETMKTERNTAMTKKSEVERKYSEILDLVTVMTPEKFKSEVTSGKKMYVYIGRPDCSDCSTLEPKLLDYIKNHKTVQDNLVFVNIRMLRQDATKLKEFKEMYHVAGIPHFALWDGGKQVSMTEWTDEQGFSIELFDKWAKENGLVN